MISHDYPTLGYPGLGSKSPIAKGVHGMTIYAEHGHGIAIMGLCVVLESTQIPPSWTTFVAIAVVLATIRLVTACHVAVACEIIAIHSGFQYWLWSQSLSLVQYAHQL